MNYTQNYHLPQWEETDRVMMKDFNRMSQDIEQGIASTVHALEVKISAAQTTANTARTEAAKLPYVMGSYVGTGENMSIDVGFKPSFVLIYQHCYYSSADYAGNCFVIASELIHSSRIYITDNGFRLDMWNVSYTYPIINVKGTQYEYIAFR